MIVAATLVLLLGGQPAQQPRFRTGVNVVEVDVVVVDDAGVPVRGLEEQDFEVLEDGRPVEIATFTAVDLPLAPADVAIPAPDASGTATATNTQPEDGRVILVILDDYHVSFDAGRLAVARATVKRLIERLGPSDQAAIIATSGRRAMQAEFTSDKARLLRAVDNFFPQSEMPATGVAERTMAPGTAASGPGFGFVHEIKARWAMETMSNAAKALAQIQNRRKAVLLVSQGIAISLEQIITNQHAGGAWQALREFILTAQRSNIAIYPVDPCGLSRDAGCSRDSQDHLRSIAEGTGGFAVLDTNAPELGVDRLIAENGAYYLIAYYSPAPPDDGKRHRIRVRVRRPGVHVRAREGYVSPRKAGARPAPSAPLDALIAAPIQTRGLPMRIAAVPAPLGGRPGSTIAVSIELRAADALQAREVAFDVVALDSSGQIRSRQRFTSGFQAPAAGPRAVARVGARLDVPAGRYQLRVGAVAEGTRGSVFTEVDVPKFDRPISLGGLSLATPVPAADASAERLGGVLPSLPIAAREVSGVSALVALLPVRTAGKPEGTISIRTTLSGVNGQTMELDRTTSNASDYAGPAGKVHRVTLKAPLPPGEYRLDVRATAGRHEASRELAFTVLGPEF
ncbi:MAG TPA: VWA domain-containing protein [Vicinamibacterales bacterium]|nr:VWA domain-containing protein [Vicinamibacterales bacterium]